MFMEIKYERKDSRDLLFSFVLYFFPNPNKLFSFGPLGSTWSIFLKKINKRKSIMVSTCGHVKLFKKNKKMSLEGIVMKLSRTLKFVLLS